MTLFTASAQRYTAQPRMPQPRPTPPRTVVLTEDGIKAMFARTTIILEDGIVPVAGQIIGWKPTSAGCLGAIVLNPLSGRRFLYGPDLAQQGQVPRYLATLN